MKKTLLSWMSILFSLVPVTHVFGTPEKPTVAVFDFKVSQTVEGKIVISTGSDTGGGVTIASEPHTSVLTDKLITALVKSGKVSVVERTKFWLLKNETELSRVGLTDPNRSVEFGKLLGADYFLLGSLSTLDGKVSYEKLPYDIGLRRTAQLIVGADIRIVETKTGKILSADSQKVTLTKAENNPSDSGGGIPLEFQREGYDELVRRLVASTIDTLFPIKVASFSESIVYLNRGGLEPGAKYRIVKVGDVVRDPDTGSILAQAETTIAIVVITEGFDKVSKGNVTDWLADQRAISPGSVCRLVLPNEASTLNRSKSGKETLSNASASTGKSEN